MAKIPISTQEFQLITTHFKAPKAGEHVRWREFCDLVDEVFTKKGLEKSIDTVVGEARTDTHYARASATDAQRENVQRIVGEFTEFVRKNRLDAKSFFQDFDRHRHFKVSQKVFRQVLTALGFQISAEDTNDIALVYGDEVYEILYADFLRDSNCLEYVINGPTTGVKSTYVTKWTDFSGLSAHEKLMLKVKNIIKKDRIRILEFFYDHDTLRKGYVAAQKFRSTLYSQKINLTNEEYDRLETHFAMPNDRGLINYVAFSQEIDMIFTDKALEKDPKKTLNAFNAPSILDPKDVLNDSEERVLVACLERLGTDVKHRRLLIKPHF